MLTYEMFVFVNGTTPGPLLVRENGKLRSPHYWKSALLESYYRNIAKTHYWESYTMYYGRNVYFLNPHYREIRTMGGRTNRGPGVFEIQCLHNLWLHLAAVAVQNLPLFGLRMKSYSYNIAGQPYYQIGSSRSSCFDFLTSSLRFSTMTSKLNRVDSTNQKCFA